MKADMDWTMDIPGKQEIELKLTHRERRELGVNCQLYGTFDESFHIEHYS